MNGWAEAIEASTFAFIEELERRGFRADDGVLTGAVGEVDDAVRVDITLPGDFPFAPPRVLPPTNFPRSWHRERDGAMCLYPADGRDELPWLDVPEFLALVARWVAESRSGWPGDFPDLDLERYFPQAESPLVVYGDLDTLNNKFVQLRPIRNTIRVTGPGSIPKKKRGGKGRSFGYVTDIGQPDAPPATWEDLKAAIPTTDATLIEKAVANGRFSYLIVRYCRGGVGAALVLRIWKDKASELNIQAVKSASDAPATLRLRAGAAAPTLGDTRIAVIGVGAVGSFICDLLSRAGIGTITAYDPDTIRPGNLIRHLAGNAMVGLTKPEAVKRVIEARSYTSTTVHPMTTSAPGPREVMALFSEHNLVIDASASGDATHLLASAAAAGGHQLLSVCLQENGSVVRVDVIPPLGGNPIPATTLGPAPGRDDLHFEAGCGDPVSQTPAFAVYEAASLAVRHAIGLLTASPVTEAGVVHDYR